MAVTREIINQQLQRLHYATGANEFFTSPILRVASATDPLFTQFKTVIGSFHWTPAEALALVSPGSTARSVLTWCLPKTLSTRESNRCESVRPSLDWARARSFGELANENIGRQLCLFLQAHGYAAVAPHLESDYQLAVTRLASNWSERHAAFVAGHGTFGLSASLITEHGTAHRLGSVVTDLALEADPRPYGDDPFAWCTRCGACQTRCPAGAIGPGPLDRDKEKCRDYAVHHIIPNRLENYGWAALSLGCGLCQTKVPCEYQRP